MKILTVIGARPQFIKAAMFSKLVKQRHGKVKEVIVHTGQHFDANMSDIFFNEMSIPVPKYNLGISSLSHGGMLGRMIEKLEVIFLKEKPDLLLVYGDTNSTLAAALAASKLGINIAHVEAGARSFDLSAPEEQNRTLTDRLSKWLFCPNQIAVNHLLEENQQRFGSEIYNSGDIMLDASLFYGKIAKKESRILRQASIESHYVLATIHRAENTSSKKNLGDIVDLINNVNKVKPVVLVLHPRTRKMLQNFKLKLQVNKVLNPLGFIDMLKLIQHSSFVLTDSGGLQREAYFFNKYSLVPLNKTPWNELVDHKYSFLTYDLKLSVEKVKEFFGKKLIDDRELFGRGEAGKFILDTLIKNF